MTDCPPDRSELPPVFQGHCRAANLQVQKPRKTICSGKRYLKHYFPWAWTSFPVEPEDGTGNRGIGDRCGAGFGVGIVSTLHIFWTALDFFLNRTYACSVCPLLRGRLCHIREKEGRLVWNHYHNPSFELSSSLSQEKYSDRHGWMVTGV